MNEIKTKKNRVGERYGRLTVIERAPDKVYSNGKRYVQWRCQCDCGTIKDIRGDNLGKVNSCGCLQKEKARDIIIKTNQTRAKEKLDSIVGKKFDKLTILENIKQTNNSSVLKCQCSCGNIVILPRRSVLDGIYKSCPDCKEKIHRFIDMTGEKFGKLTVLFPVFNKNKDKKNRSQAWLCQCDCGNTTVISRDALIRGNTISCGCLKQSRGEYIIENLLKNNNILYQKEYSPFDYKPNSHARFDFFVDNKYLIEFDGAQHYYSNNRWWNTDNYVIELQEKNKIKNEWCKTNQIPLIRIPYTHINNIVLEDLLLETSQFIIKE